MKKFVVVKCEICDFQYDVKWADILAYEYQGLRLGDYIYMGVCPQCGVLHRGQIIEDIRGLKLKG